MKSWVPTAALVACLVAPPGLSGQFTEVPPPAAYAVQNVRVVQTDGSVMENVTIVVRGGMIEAIGSDVEPPADAEILAGDSLHVYPGLFDGDGEIEFEFPETEFNRSQIPSWDPPRELQGFTPERRVVEALSEDLSGSSVSGMLDDGVVAAAVHPDGALMPGQGALFLFRPWAADGHDLVVVPDLGHVMTLQSARGAYPGQLFGVMAFIRQQFADAARYQQVWDAYQRRPAGMETPHWDPAYETVREIQQGGRVFFRAHSSEDIRRALQLGDELGFQPVILGGREAWKLADELARRGVDVLVSVDFPEPDRWDPDDETPEDELDPAAWRERRDIQNAYRNAGALVAAGVRIGLTSGGGDADLLEGARKTLEQGMSESDALRALTIWPAEIYRVPALTRLEAGYPATFVAYDRPLFDDDARVIYTLVEGQLERGADPSGSSGGDDAADAEAAVDLTGTWEVEIRAEGFETGGTMTITQEGSAFTGEMSLDVGEATIQAGRVSGTDVTFEVDPGEDAGGVVEVSGTVEDDRFTGTGSQGTMTFRIEATRTPGGER